MWAKTTLKQKKNLKNHLFDFALKKMFLKYIKGSMNNEIWQSNEDENQWANTSSVKSTSWIKIIQFLEKSIKKLNFENSTFYF
jgi:vesicle coat complex subunit